MNQNKKSIIVVNDVEGWLMMEILKKMIDLKQFNIIRYNQTSNELELILQTPNIFLLCSHSNAEGEFYYGRKIRKISWDECKFENMITCFYDSQTKNLDEYIRLPGFLVDKTPVLYKLSYEKDFVMSHNNKYRKKLAMIKQQVENENLDVVDVYLKVMMPFILKIKPEYELINLK
jgi:hypothetical protein